MAEATDKNVSNYTTTRICSPPSGKFASILTRILQVAIAYGLLWSILGKQALPGSNLFALFVVVTASSLGGFIVASFKGPALLGMLVVGFMLRNVPAINIAKDIDQTWSGNLRAMALAIILTRAGLGKLNFNLSNVIKNKRIQYTITSSTFLIIVIKLVHTSFFPVISLLCPI